MNGFLYVLKNPRNGNVLYVGSTTQPQLRYYQHMSNLRLNPSPFYLFLRKEWIVPKMEIVDAFEFSTRKEMYRKERDLISCFDQETIFNNALTPHYNLTEKKVVAFSTSGIPMNKISKITKLSYNYVRSVIKYYS